MSEMMYWADYYMRMSGNPMLTLDEQVSYYVAAQQIMAQIRREVEG